MFRFIIEVTQMVMEKVRILEKEVTAVFDKRYKAGLYCIYDLQPHAGEEMVGMCRNLEKAGQK